MPRPLRYLIPIALLALAAGSARPAPTRPVVAGYERLFAHGAKRVPKTYSSAVQETVRELREALGLSEKRFE